MKKQIKRFMCILLSLLLFVNGLQGFTLPARADTPSSVQSLVPSSVPLHSLKAGDTVNFAGYTWIVLDPDTGYLLMQGSLGEHDFSNARFPSFNPNTSPDDVYHIDYVDIAHYLNNDFYNKLPVQDQAVIQSHSWTTGGIYGDTKLTPNVNCKIGLIGDSEMILYKDIISNLPESWWTRSAHLVQSDGSIDRNRNTDWDVQQLHAVRPALYVDSDVLVSGGNGGTVLEGAKASTLTKLSAMKAGARVNFAGYTWIVLDPDKGYLLMQYSYCDKANYNNSFVGLFDPNDPQNMGYYLNYNFLSSLPAADQALIQTHDWTTGDMGNDTNLALVATCKVGLISFSEYRTYEPLIPRLVSWWWTRTPESSHYGAYIYMVKEAYTNDESYAVRPALYLDPDILISGRTVLQQTPTPVITAPVSVGATSVSGTAAAGASIVLRVNGVASTAVTADASGHWTVGGLSLAQSDSVSVTAEAAGNPVSAAATVQISVNIAAIAGVTAPVEGAAPVSAIPDTAQYTATIAWSPVDSVFAPRTPYTATITITPKAGYTLAGVPRNFFTVAGATATNDAGSGIVTAVFPAIAAQPGTLSALEAGNTVNFANHSWIVLDPGKGYLLMQDTYDLPRSYGPRAFDPASGIAYYLNNNFYNTLPTADQAVIQSHNWTTGVRPNDTNPTPYVTCKIGLISYSEYQAYIHLISNCTGQWWTRTVGSYNDEIWMVFPTGGLSLCDTTGSFAGSASAYARPALYLNPDMKVSGGNGGTVSDQAITPAPTIASPVRAGATGVSGTAAAGASVVLSANGSASPAVTADASGHWAVSGLALAQGDSLCATAQLPGEEVSPAATSAAVAADAAATIRINAIPGITNPVAGAAPVSSITATSEYTAAVSWSPADAVFAAQKAYTATITITPKAGYTLAGVPRDFFTVAGATATNSAGSGVVTAVFSAAAGRPRTLSALKAGSTVNFAGDQWMVLDPGKGYLIKLEPYGDPKPFNSDYQHPKNTFDPTDPANIGYYLNHSFYDSLSAADQALIQTHDWTTGDTKNDTDPALHTTCKIGLISYSEYTAYQDLVRSIPDYWTVAVPDWWTRTPSLNNDENWTVGTDERPHYSQVYHCYSNSDYLESFPCDRCDVHPTLYLNPDIMVSGGDGGVVLRQTLQPVILSPIAAGATSVSGTAAGGASIVLSVNGSASPSVTADPDGHWTVSGLKLAQRDTVCVTAAAIGNAVSPATTVTVAVPINIAEIAGVIPPVTGATPVSAIDTPEYTAAVTWSGADTTFEPGKAYTATITVTPKAGYTLAGLPRNFFTVAGATATNDAGSGVVTAAFPMLAGQLGTLSALAAGSTVKFGGYDWILLDPGKGYLLMKGAYGSDRGFASYTFDPADQGSIAYYLNHDFYASLSSADQASIQSHQWTIKDYDPVSSESLNQTHFVTCKIALLSSSEYNAYIGNISDISHEWWLLDYDSGFNWAVISYGSLEICTSDTHNSVHPALYLNRDTLVTNGTVSDQVRTPTPTISGPVEAGSTSVSGTAAAGASVVLRVNGAPSAAVTSDTHGQWTVSELRLAQGDSLSATAQLTGENISAAATAKVVAPIVTVTDVTVTPSAVTALIGNLQTFNAAVNGRNHPAQDVTWSVSGNHSADTSISSSGILTIGIDETAASLTVRATSTFDNTKSGTATVTVDSSKYLTGISMKTLPEKINYMAGQSLDLTGASLTLSYSDNSTECIPVLPSMVSGFDSAKAGAQTVTVTYMRSVTSFSVHVIPALISNQEHSVTVDVSGANLPPDVTSVTVGGGIVADDGSSSSFYDEVRTLFGQFINGFSIGGLRLLQIELLDQNGNPIKNFGKVTVKIPIPSGMKGNLHVYWYDPDGHTLTDMQATQKDGYLIFDTTHFSYYAVAQLNAESATNISNPPTGANNTSGLLTLFALPGAIGTAIVVKRKRARNKRKV